jgi:hypothetical protein
MGLRGRGFLLFLFLALTQLFEGTSAWAIPLCGASKAQTARPDIAWSTVLSVRIKIPMTGESSVEIYGRLCAGWKSGAGRSIDAFAFHTDSGFDNVFLVTTVGKSKGLSEKASVVFTHQDLAAVSTLAGLAVRKGELLTLGLKEIQIGDGKTEYEVELRFPQQLAKNVWSKQPDDFHQIDMKIVRIKGNSALETYVAGADAPGSLMQIDIDWAAMALSKIVVSTEENDLAFLPKDFPVAAGAFYKTDAASLKKRLEQLAVAEAAWAKDGTRWEEKSPSHSRGYSNRFGYYPIP